MTDLDLIRELRPDQPLAAARDLAPARRRLTDAIAAATNPALTPAPDRHFIYPKRIVHTPLAPVTPVRPRRSRLALGGIALTAAAGVAATVLIAVPHSHGRPTVPPSSASSPPGHPGPASAIKPFTGRLTVARFLDAAAQAALTQPARPPRPGQYVYSETEGPGNYRYQIWQSADGSQPGLIITRLITAWLPRCTVAQAEATHCTTTAGYLAGLPVRPSAVLAYLTKVGMADESDQPGGSSLHKPINHWVADNIGKTLTVLLANTYLRPAQRAALYEFMARTPGFTVARHAVDALGRPGIGIRWTYEGTAYVIIFSRRNYAYLGITTTYDGQPSFSDALVKFAFVDHLPPHATPSMPPESVLKRKPDTTPSPVPSTRG